MPDHADGNGRQRDGQGCDVDLVHGQRLLGQTTGYRAQQVRAGYQGRNGQVMRHLQLHLTPHLGRPQHDLQRSPTAATGQHRHMPAALIALDIQPGRQRRVTSASDDDQRLFQQRGVAQLGVVKVQVIERQIQLARTQAGGYGLSLIRLHRQHHPGRMDSQLRQQGG